jgi:hypothetical protein
MPTRRRQDPVAGGAHLGGQDAHHCRPAKRTPWLKAAKEGAERTWVTTKVLGRLDQHPARLAVASFGDRAVVGVLGRLLRTRHETEIARSVVAVGEAAENAESRKQALRARR